MKIETEFNIGDVVWVVEVSWVDDVADKYEVVGPKTIRFIKIYINNSGVQEFYDSEDFGGLYQSDQLFKTREAAEITAEALNK